MTCFAPCRQQALVLAASGVPCPQELSAAYGVLYRHLLLPLLSGVGAYQDSRGNQHVRAEVAKFIEERDGVGPADPNVSVPAEFIQGFRV